MADREAIEVVENLLRSEFPGWRVETEPAEKGIGIVFKLVDEKSAPRHILGITDEVFGAHAAATGLRSLLAAHGIRQKLDERGRVITWLSTGGWLEAAP